MIPVAAFVAGILTGLSCARYVCRRIMRKTEALLIVSKNTLAAARFENERTAELLAKVTELNRPKPQGGGVSVN